jgi:hypothetical protein
MSTNALKTFWQFYGMSFESSDPLPDIVPRETFAMCKDIHKDSKKLYIT